MLSVRRLLFSITAIPLLFSLTACGNIQEETSTESQHMLVNGAFEDTNSSMSSVTKDNLQENPSDSGSENLSETAEQLPIGCHISIINF
jgi:hypothetical protein